MSEISASTKRIFFLDNLKSFIICLMIVFHIAMSYMQYVPEWWYAVDKADPQLSFTFFVVWADIFIMPIMFFISGYFGIMSLSRQTAKSFWKSKLMRIGIPWVLGVLLLAPAVTYLIFLTRHVPLPFTEYLNKVFFFGPLFSHTQYWFLGTLFYLYVILFVVARIKPVIKEKLAPEAPGKIFFLVIAILTYALTVGAYYLVGGQ
ncbi:Acyltransferase [Anaerovibrio sp. JC8]|uniref:acyltransferase family protein n=1 Tax=Anaerovibrio sp. JC8 TaxID=1240085 RepID=UPI000A0C163A|nr:acyltransferase family protein [Anaerovibrio sp. JC8]ORU01261.1 Acyltransferase [Anaerovibrio sp. JC8]